MSNVVSKSDPLTSSEVTLISNIQSLGTSGAGFAIAKTGTNTFANVALVNLDGFSFDHTTQTLSVGRADTGFTLKANNQTVTDFSGQTINMYGSDGLGTGLGGDFNFLAGNGGVTGDGGNFVFTAGNGGGTSGNAGSMGLIAGGVGLTGNGGDVYVQPTLGSGVGTPGHFRIVDAVSGFSSVFDGSLLSADQTFTLPNATGTVALTSDIPSTSGLVPYTGGTSNVDLGTHNLTVDTNSLFVDSVNHRIGIGTVSPGAKLDVYGPIQSTNGGYGTLPTDYAANSLVMSGGGASPNSSSIMWGDSSGWKLNFGTNLSGTFTPRVTMVDNGNVGIGTTNPGTKLDVNGNTNIGSVATPSKLTIVGTSAGVLSTSQINISDGGGANAKELWLGYDTTNDLSYIQSIHQNSGYTALALQPQNGNVGIGTTGPGKLLEVSGSNDTGLTALRISNISSANNVTKYIEQEFYGSDTIGAPKRTGAIRVTPAGVNYLDSNISIIARGGDADSLIMTMLGNTGNVGIGTATPADILSVQSTAGHNVILNYGVGVSSNLDIGGILWSFNNTNNAGRIWLNGNSNSSSDGTTRLAFGAHANGVGAVSEALSILSTGKIGIGNISPSALLTIGTAGTTAGALSLAGSTSGTATLVVPAAAGTPIITLPTVTSTLATMVLPSPIRLMGYTVATLPAGTTGDSAYCTDLLAPTFLTAAVGGGTVVGKVFFNGSAWITD